MGQFLILLPQTLSPGHCQRYRLMKWIFTWHGPAVLAVSTPLPSGRKGGWISRIVAFLDHLTITGCKTLEFLSQIHKGKWRKTRKQNLKGNSSAPSSVKLNSYLWPQTEQFLSWHCKKLWHLFLVSTLAQTPGSARFWLRLGVCCTAQLPPGRGPSRCAVEELGLDSSVFTLTASRSRQQGVALHQGFSELPEGWAWTVRSLGKGFKGWAGCSSRVFENSSRKYRVRWGLTGLCYSTCSAGPRSVLWQLSWASLNIKPASEEKLSAN